MSNKLAVTINSTPVEIKEYQGQRVVTLKEIDEVHQRPSGTAGRNFNENKEHFISGVDYFHLTQEESRSTNFVERPNPKGLTLITESGYLMLVKSFTDDLAWTVQRQLVNTYFRVTTDKPTPPDDTKRITAEAKLNNSRARLASMWLRVANAVSVPEYKDVCASYASAALAGKEALALPACEEHLYTATEIGEKLGGIDKAMIGRIANRHNMKTPEYGKTVWDKSPYSSKQVESFRYNEKAVRRFEELLGGN